MSSDTINEPRFKQNELISFRDSMDKQYLINPAMISEIDYDFKEDRFLIITMASGNVYTVNSQCRELLKKIGVDPYITFINPTRDAQM